nr:immunoglobulin heavy chain junction region [Mus musculus]
CARRYYGSRRWYFDVW